MAQGHIPLQDDLGALMTILLRDMMDLRYLTLN